MFVSTSVTRYDITNWTPNPALRGIKKNFNYKKNQNIKNNGLACS